MVTNTKVNLKKSVAIACITWKSLKSKIIPVIIWYIKCKPDVS